MWRYRTFYFVLQAIIALKVCFAQEIDSSTSSGCFSSPVQQAGDEMETSQNHDDIVLYLVYENIHNANVLGSEWFVHKLIVWKDGRVLFGHFVPTARAKNDNLRKEESMKYSWGKTDPKKVAEYVKKIQTSFHFDERGGEIQDTGPDASNWILHGRINGKVYTVVTWELYDNARLGRQVMARIGRTMVEHQTIDGKPFMLSQFYDVWKKIKNDVCEWGESTVKEDSMDVRVIVDRFEATVLDENEKALVHVRRLPGFCCPCACPTSDRRPENGGSNAETGAKMNDDSDENPTKRGETEK